jgi:ATP-dependent RNA/DNA helicase IGHMBP2
MNSPSTADDFFDRFLRWLELEGRAEADERRTRLARLSAAESEKQGTTLVDMAVDDEDAGLGGRWLWTLCKRNRTLRLPWTRLGTGTPVLLTGEDPAAAPLRGVISQRNERSVTVALPAPPEDVDSSGSWRIDLSSDETARERQRSALRALRGAKHGRLQQWRDLLLGARDPRFHEEPPIRPFDENLNAAQQEAVRFALSADDFAILHGPPGTGKTTTLIEFIRQAVARREKVLVAAGSNLGVDNVLERLAAAGTRVVRLGHPARVTPALRDLTLDYLVEAQPEVAVAAELRKEAADLFRKAGRWTRAKPLPGERAAQRGEARRLLDDARRLESGVEKHLLDEADVICATLTGLDASRLDDREFQWCVVDEAAQTTEPPCWIPLTRSKRLVLAGDHCQLPPTIVSNEAARQGFAASLMERLMQRGGGRWSRLLDVQYRMHRQIMAFSSEQFYEGRLTADPSVAERTLVGLPNLVESPRTAVPLELIDTAGAGFEESEAADSDSRFNEGEAKIAIRCVRSLLDAGLDPRDVAVVTPYAAQVRLIRERLDLPEVEVDSVDGFQGREKEAIVVSLVRSNDDGEIGFLGDVRRMNVALTRARRKLIVIGDGAVLGGHPFYRALLDYFEREGGYHSVWEEPFDD